MGLLVDMAVSVCARECQCVILCFHISVVFLLINQRVDLAGHILARDTVVMEKF